jgi:putative ABC transport system permease protein
VSDQLSSDLAALRISREEPAPSGRWRVVIALLGVAGLVGLGWVFAVPYLEARIFKLEVETTHFFSMGAMIGAMITMYGAVSQRASEIGVLRALGFSRSAIMGSFLLESVLLALLGAALGTGAALLLGMVEFSILNFQTFSEIVFRFEPSPSILVTAGVAGGVMGVIGGFLPAIRAANISPIEAMRG